MKKHCGKETRIVFSGRALITGGTSGMGYEFAKQLALRGLNIVLVARNEERLRKTAAELAEKYGVECTFLSADLASDAGVAAVKERLVCGENPITVFVNNAGGGLYAKIASKDFTEIKNALQVMGTAPMELGGAAAAVMKERNAGVIISTASVASLVPMGAYAAIKALLRYWSESLANELHGTNVHVVTFLPGWVHTEFHARTGVSNASIPKWVWMNAADVVGETLAAAEAGKEVIIPSRKFKAIAFFAKHMPRSIVCAAVRKLNRGRR